MLAETELLKKIAKLCRATYLTASARLDTARTGLNNSTNRARKMHCSGTKWARFGLERISSWARNWHDLGSKTAPVELETGTL